MASYLDSSGVTYIFDVINNQWWNSKEATLPKTSFIIGDGQNSSAQKGALGVKSFGVSSVAAGKHSIAQGDYSFSMGEGNLSMGNKSTSLGGSFEVFEFSGEVNSTSYFTTIPNHYKEIVGAHVYMNETDDESSAIITAVSEGENGLVVELDKTLSDEGLVDQPIYINFNIARGESSFTHGSNIVSGDLDFATGYGNLSAGYSNFIAGEDNSVKGSLNAVFGANNQFIDENNYNNYIFGESNFVIPIPANEDGESYSNFSNFVVGADNAVSGEGNKIFGEGNTIEGGGFLNFVVGAANDVYGEGNFVAGEGNTIEGALMTSFGRQNETLLTMGTPLNGFMAGHNLQVQNDDVEIALGKWNKSNIADSESGRTLLSIGAGDEEERSNALEVMQNGDIYLGGHGSIYKLWDHKNKKTDFVTDLKTIEGNILEGVGDIDLESVTFKGFVDIESGTQGIDELAKSMRVGDVAMCMGTNATGGFGGKLSPDFFRIDDYTDEDLEKFRSENLLPLYFASEFAYMEGANNIIGRLVGAPSDEISEEMSYENLSTLSPMDVILVAKMDLNEVLGGGEEVPIEYEDVTNEVEFNEVDTLDHFKHIIGDAGGNVEEIILPPHFPEYMYVPNSKMSTPVGVGAFRYTYNISTPNIVDDLGESITDKDYIVQTFYDKKGRALQSLALNIGEIKADPNNYGFNNYSSSSTISFGLTSGTIADLNDPEFLMEAMGVEVCYIGFSFVSRNDLIAIDDSVNSLPTETPDYSHSDGLTDPDMIYNPIYHYQDVLIKSMDTPLVTTLTYQTVKLSEYVEQTGPAIFERINSGSLFQELTGEEIPDDLNSVLPKFIYIQTPDTYTHILNESTLSDWIGLETTDVLNMDDYIALSISRLDISKKPYMTQFIKIEDAEKYGFISYFEDDVKGHYLSDELIEKLYFDYNFLGGDAQVAINLAYIKSSEAVILGSQQETNFDGETYELYMGAIGETPAIHTEVYYKYLKPTASSLATEIPVLFCKIIRTNVLEIFNYLAIAGDVLKVLFGDDPENAIANALEDILQFIGLLMGLGVGEFLTSGSFMYMDDILDIADEFMRDIDNGNVAPPPSSSDGAAGMITEIIWILSYFAPKLIDRIPKKIENNLMVSGVNGVIEMIQVAMSLNNPISPFSEMMGDMSGMFPSMSVDEDTARDFLINQVPNFMQEEVYPLVSKIYTLPHIFEMVKVDVDNWCNELDQNFIRYINMMDSDNHTNGVDPVDVCNQMGYSGDGKIILNDGYVGYTQDFEFKGFRNGEEIFNYFTLLDDINYIVQDAGFENIMQPIEILREIGGYLQSCVEAVGNSPNSPIYTCKYPIRFYLYLILHTAYMYYMCLDMFMAWIEVLGDKIINNFPLIMIADPADPDGNMMISDQWTLDLLERYLSPTAPDSEAILNVWQNSERLPISDIINIISESVFDESLKLFVTAVSPYMMTVRMDPNQSLSEELYSWIYELIKFGAVDRVRLEESEFMMMNTQQEVNSVKISSFLIENGNFTMGDVGDFEINRETFIKNPYEIEQLISQSNKNIQPFVLEDMLESGYPQGEMVTVANAWTENKLLSELPIFETNEETGENNLDELNILNNLEIDLDVIKSLPTLSSSYTISLPTLNDERIIDININIDENSNISNMVLHSDLLTVPLDGEEILYKDENGEFVLNNEIVNTLNQVLSCNKSLYYDIHNQETGEHITEEDMSVLDNIFKVTIAHELDSKLYIKGTDNWNEVVSAHEPTLVENIVDIL